MFAVENDCTSADVKCKIKVFAWHVSKIARYEHMKNHLKGRQMRAVYLKGFSKFRRGQRPKFPLWAFQSHNYLFAQFSGSWKCNGTFSSSRCMKTKEPLLGADCSPVWIIIFKYWTTLMRRSQILMAKCSFVCAAVEAPTRSQTLFTKIYKRNGTLFKAHGGGKATAEPEFSCKN